MKRQALPWRYGVCAAWLVALTCWVAGARATEEVPFITTPDKVTLAMLQIAKVGPKDYVIDLGSGDGRIVILAAKRFGARGLGVEIVPDLVQRSRTLAERAGVAGRAEFREQDLFKTDLSAASVITMYLLPEVNLQLRPALLALKPGTRIVSHDWDMGDWLPDRTITLEVPEKSIGLEKRSRVHLWVVPMRVEGLWCSPGLRGGYSLHISQAFQQIRLRVPGVQGLNARVDGTELRSFGPGGDELHLLSIGDRLQVTRARGALAPMAGSVFTRAAVPACPQER